MAARDQSGASSVDEYLATTNYLECRADGHAWRRTHTGWMVEGRGRSVIYSKRLVCMRCETEKVDRRDWQFERMHPKIKYPEAYLASGLGLVKNDVIRYEITTATQGANGARSTGRKRSARRSTGKRAA